MQTYSIWEGYMDDLRKKVATVQKKCARYGCDFHFSEIGDEIREVEDYNRVNPETGKAPMLVPCRFVICEAEGKAVVNGWQFVASVDHTEKGNLFGKALTDVEIPERYRYCEPYCEHCNSVRARRGTFIVINTETHEFKQIGRNCLMDYTHGMSAQYASLVASLRDIFETAERCEEIGGSLHSCHEYHKTEEYLRFAAETIRHFGYARSDSAESTKSRVREFYDYTHGHTRFWDYKELDRVSNLMESVGFNADSEEAHNTVRAAVEWLDEQPESNDYMHNLKVAVALDYVKDNSFGLLVSLFPTWNKDLAQQARRKAEAEAGKRSEFVGNIGDKVEFDVDSVKCVTSWENSFGYRPTTTYIWKITDKRGNIFTWKTASWLSEENPPKTVRGTVKEHKTFREVKQTELTRCRVLR